MASVRLPVSVGLSSMFRLGVMPSKPVSLLNWQRTQATFLERTWEVIQCRASRGHARSALKPQVWGPSVFLKRTWLKGMAISMA
jgi:hypothetical protein